MYVAEFINNGALSSNLKNISTDQIKKNLNCKSGDTPIIDGNYAYCRSVKANCPDSYPYAEGNKCYQRGCNGKGIYNKSTQKCEYANSNYPCDKGYTYNKSLRKCLKKDVSAYDETLRYDCPSGYSSFKASNGVPYCATYRYVSFKYYCPSGATKVGDGPSAYCLTYKTTNVYQDAIPKIDWTCPKGYTKISKEKGYCVKDDSLYGSQTLYRTYVCPSGYKKVPGTQSNCYKTLKTPIKSEILKK